MAIEARRLLYSENSDFTLRGPQDFLVDNACGFNNLPFVPHQQKQIMPFGFIQNLPQQENFNVFLDINTASSSSLPRNGASDKQSMAFSHIFSAQIEKQKMEIDRFISLQNERLILALQEQRKQQNALLLKKMEPKTLFLLKQREEEMAKAANRTVELQDFLKRMEIENQTWQNVARENEAMIASLNSKIGRLKETVNPSSNAAEDAESCCENIEEQRTGNTDHSKKMICRRCYSRNPCVIMLPCRHLCSCKNCEAFIDFCPVCGTVKKACIEALI